MSWRKENIQITMLTIMIQEKIVLRSWVFRIITAELRFGYSAGNYIPSQRPMNWTCLCSELASALKN